MNAVPESLATCAPGLAVSPLPIWVLDLETLRICWANERALALWHADSVEELAARDIVRDAPAPVLTRLRHAIARVLTGTAVAEEWTFYPRGKPTPVLLHLRSVTLADGRLGMLNQAAGVDPDAAPAVLRAVTAFRHLTTVVAFVGPDGEIRSQNPEALAEFGDLPSCLQWFVDADQARRILRAAHAGEHVRTEAAVRGLQGERWHSVQAHVLRDPVLGDLGILLLHRDETARRAAEQAAAAHLARLEDQRREILALSAPLLVCGDRTIVAPLIGHLDEPRSRDISERLLLTIAERRIRRVVLDLTGLVDLDLPAAQRLRELLAAVRLLGAAPILTGLRPALAANLVASGVDLQGERFHRSLADILALR